MENREDLSISDLLFFVKILKYFLNTLTDNCIMDMIQLRSVLYG